MTLPDAMKADIDPERGIPEPTPTETVDDMLTALTDTPDDRCIKAAHPFGSNYIRYDARREQWRQAKLCPTMSGGTIWMETRIYPERLRTLLRESEASVGPMDRYPQTYP